MTRKRRPQHNAVAHSPPRQPAATNPQLAATILEIVDTQLLGGTPPETRETFDRLITAGYTPTATNRMDKRFVSPHMG